jgi:hypothetical protein
MRHFLLVTSFCCPLLLPATAAANEQFNPPSALQTPPSHDLILLAPPPKAVPASPTPEAVHQWIDSEEPALQNWGLASPSQQQPPGQQQSDRAALSNPPNFCPAISVKASELGGAATLDLGQERHRVSAP